MTKLLAVVFHTEKPHDDEVWRVLGPFAERAARRAQPLTFFVHPFWAFGSGDDPSARVRQLVDLGHEVGQHTHYYGRGTVSVDRKVDDFTNSNVLRRLEEDRAWLLDVGIRPRGFVSGSWEFPEVLSPWLAEHAYAYDCTWRMYAPLPARARSRSEGPARQPFLLSAPVLEVPTTAPLRAASLGLLRRQAPAAILADIRYQLVYLHDDDMLHRRKRMALSALLYGSQRRGWRLVTVGTLADQLRHHVESRP